MERKDIRFFALAEFVGLVIAAAGIFDRVNTLTPPFEAIQPDPSYTLMFNIANRFRSSTLIATGVSLSLTVPLAAGLSYYESHKTTLKR